MLVLFFVITGSNRTHQASAQTEHSGVLALRVDVPAEEAVAHIAGVVEVRVGVAAPLRSQVCHRVRGRNEAGVCAQVEMETFPKRVDPVEKPQSRQVII